jgi:uncharacterized membrane protein
MMRHLAGVTVLIGVLVLGLPGAARANWEMCNHTSYIAEVATSSVEQAKRITEGWKRLRPGECRIVQPGPLVPGEYMFYARSSRAHEGALQRWNGKRDACIDDGDFSIAGEADCEEVGFQTRGFMAISINKPVWRTTLSEPADFDKSQARTAGLQRLLRDNGYSIRTIDGASGRDTIRQGRSFLQEVGLPLTTPENDIIDKLEERARQLREPQGLTLCNKASRRVWTAVALRRADSFESRGWWALEAGDCAKVISEALRSGPYFIYASREEEGGRPETKLAAATEPFCTGETSFSIPGRENCPRRGFLEQNFMPLVSDGKEGRTLTFTDRDFATSPLALR